MSHIMTIQTEVRDPAAIAAACERLRRAAPVHGTATLFSGEATGWLVQLPGWRYPLVCDTKLGELRFDIYEGRWGNRTHLDQFLQAYAVEKARIEARKRGYDVVERSLPDGSIKLTLQVGGAT